MSTISGAVGPSAFTASTADRFGELTSDDFVKLMFTELGRQDPLQPSDAKALLEQLSLIRSIQSDLELGQRLESTALQQELASAAGLIGRQVSGLALTGERVEGEVESVLRTSAGAVLEVDGRRVPMWALDFILSGPPGESPSDGSAAEVGAGSEAGS